MLCAYRANDAESVRLVLRHQGFADAAVIPVAFSGIETAGPGGENLVAFEFGLQNPEPGRQSATRLSGVGALQKFNHPAAAISDVRDNEPLAMLVKATDEADFLRCLASANAEPDCTWQCREIDPRPDTLFAESMTAEDLSNDFAEPRSTPCHAVTDFDAIIVGAGLSGVTALQRLASMGLRVQVYESAADVGGVWHWNRYPGARVDSETYTYGFAFSNELVDDWDWQELFCAQPEIERYFKYVVDRFDLRSCIKFSTDVTSAHYDSGSSNWVIEIDTGDCVSARYLVIASGNLSTPQLPDIAGMDSFDGLSFHTGQWPASGVELANKRVGVIGTGASGVQVIQTIAGEVDRLAVFQRTPTYCVPQRNRALTDAERQAIRDDWQAILAACNNSYSGFIHTFDERSGLAVTATEREELFEALWQMPGFAFWFGNFADLMMNAEVNEYACEFVRQKIRERVQDPEVARKLMPDHPFGTKRIPLENGYYEVFNRDNVQLVDLGETPIEAITRSGIRTVDREYPLDVIVYATGFDAGTGAFNRIDIRGRNDIEINDKWRDGPRTFLGLMVSGFPNLFMVNGPQNPAGLCNAGRCIEQNVDWIARAIEHLRTNNLTRIEPTAEAEMRWTDHVEDAASGTVLAANTNSWYFGANTPGKPRRVTIYAAGASNFRQQCENVARRRFAGCMLS